MLTAILFVGLYGTFGSKWTVMDAPLVLAVKYFGSLLFVTGFVCGYLSNSIDRLSMPSFVATAEAAACGFIPSLTPEISNYSASTARGEAAETFAARKTETAINARWFMDAPNF